MSTAGSRSLVLAWAVAVVVVVGWGVNFVLAKHALNQLDVGPFNFLRFGGMAALGWLVVLATRGVRPVPAEDRPRFLIVAGVGFCGYVFGFSVGLSLTSAFSASLLLALVPLWVLAFTSISDRRLPTPTAMAALAVGATGTAIFVSARTEVALGWGDLISLAVAAAYAGYLMLNRSLVARYPPFTLTTYAISLASIPILAGTAPTLAEQDWSGVTGSGWAAMVWVVVGPVFVAWSVWSWVQRHLEPTRLAPLLFLVPVVSGFAAWLFLDESITGGQVLGTAIVVAGLVLNQRAGSGEPPRRAAQVAE